MALYRFFLLICFSALCLSSVAAMAAAVQMLPPVQSDNLTNTCLSSGGNKVLSWDGQTAIKCHADVMVSSTGNVGVGTNTPQSKLDVNGGVRVGQDNAGCIPDKEGTVRYNPTTRALDYCTLGTWTPINGFTPSRLNIVKIQETLCKWGGVYTMVAVCPVGYELLGCGGGPGDQLEYAESWVLDPDFAGRQCLGRLSQPACNSTLDQAVVVASCFRQ